MASGVSVKMGVTGVAQFKQSMKESQAAVKNLDQQLKLNEAQLKLNGNEELALQNKTELLTKQIEEQKNVVKQANSALEAMQKNGVEKTSVEFQKMQQQVYKASTDLMNMQAELQGVDNAGEDAQSGVSHMNQALQRIGTNVSFESVVEGIGKITGGLEAAAEKAIQLGKKLVQAMLSGGQWADDLQDTADKWEITPQQLYRMQQTANLIDTSAETIHQSRQKLIKAMGEQDNKETMGAFAALGITDLTGTQENIEDIFWTAGQRLMGMNSDEIVARNEYAMKLFGRSWEELIPIFKTGREEYERTMASWDWIGDQQFQALTQLDDESQKTRSAWENIQHTLEAAMAPTMTEIMVALQGMMSEFNKYLQSEEGQEMLAKLSEAVTSLFTEFTNLDPAEVIGKLTDIFESIRTGLQWLIDNKQTVYDALAVIAAGFGLLKITELAANIGRVVSGLGGLTGGGKGGQGGTDAGTAGAESTGGTGGFWAGLINKMTLAAGAYAVNKATEGKIRELNEAFKALTAGKTSQEQSDIAYAQMLGMTADEYAAFMANKPEQKANGAEYYGQDWRPSYMRDLENPMNKMSEVAGEMTGEISATRQANESMTAAVTDLNNLPASLQEAVTSAIIAGMNSVTIVINESCVDTIGERISYGFGGKVVAEIQ